LPFVLKKHNVPAPQKAFLFLVRELGLSQKEAQRYIAKGRLFKDSKPITSPTAIIEGEVEFVEFEPITKGLKPIIEEEHFVVYDKPSGVLIHPQSRYTPYSLVDELRYAYGKEANITHRIDQETSGIVLCAKSKQAEIDIKYLFENRQIEKTYLAFVRGRISKTLVIDEPLLRQKHHHTNIRTIVIVDKKGKPSKTTVKPLKYFSQKDVTLVEAKPHTGRQHQIRVHLFHVKHPIIGDPLYGQSFENMMKYFDRELSKEERIKNTLADRLLLHANTLKFDLYEKNYYIKSKTNFEKIALKSLL
jgi:23S rRNA pseudouridine1911/1915/1917 synthase